MDQTKYMIGTTKSIAKVPKFYFFENMHINTLYRNFGKRERVVLKKGGAVNIFRILSNDIWKESNGVPRCSNVYQYKGNKPVKNKKTEYPKNTERKCSLT